MCHILQQSADDYLTAELSLDNKTELKYDISLLINYYLRFNIIDKSQIIKITKNPVDYNKIDFLNDYCDLSMILNRK